ncbi:type II toxin-antitoxin system death-on-curing family toxin [Paenibacillus sp. YPG26]|uniref:type II toxin-antitoxin system death-on-curing family toxin n=1 Tax=Paenibacillus sp. YPG26 TaxID=2878915 RepID=UPI00203DFC26|nr:type II toxin-antitoxin system death-on-curing family toxin [Paenibacillus sp. YPG26]USB34054.1 type II toxin-antitoxin system death-on-curing family toxin [Paenibacillus sp. YPG26]
MYVKLTPEQIIEIHDEELMQTGGLPGIKDRGYVELLSEKPFSDYFGEEQYPGLFLKAAVLMHGIIAAHCFNDCNKRTAVVCTYTFLYLNGYELVVDEDELFDITISVATKDIDLHILSNWLQENTVNIG